MKSFNTLAVLRNGKSIQPYRALSTIAGGIHTLYTIGITPFNIIFICRSRIDILNDEMTLFFNLTTRYLKFIIITFKTYSKRITNLAIRDFAFKTYLKR